jgi:hypothetical protein
MPTNTAINFSLVAGTVPPDRNCPKNGQEVVQLVQDFVSVNGATSSGDPVSPGDSVAEQALNTANTALAAVQELQGAQKQVRASGIIAIPTGDSNFGYTFTPAMPSVDYDISVAIYAGAAGFIGTFYGWRVLESSITVNGFNLIFDNLPANSKIAIRVVER